MDNTSNNLSKINIIQNNSNQINLCRDNPTGEPEIARSLIQKYKIPIRSLDDNVRLLISRRPGDIDILFDNFQLLAGEPGHTGIMEYGNPYIRSRYTIVEEGLSKNPEYIYVFGVYLVGPRGVIPYIEIYYELIRDNLFIRAISTKLRYKCTNSLIKNIITNYDYVVKEHLDDIIYIFKTPIEPIKWGSNNIG